MAPTIVRSNWTSIYRGNLKTKEQIYEPRAIKATKIVRISPLFLPSKNFVKHLRQVMMPIERMTIAPKIVIH